MEWGGGFVGRLGKFRELYNGPGDGEDLKAWRKAVLAYPRQAGPTMLSWMLLTEMARDGAGADARHIAEQFRRFGNYAGKYEAARVERDGKAMIALFHETLKAGSLPPIAVPPAMVVSSRSLAPITHGKSRRRS